MRIYPDTNIFVYLEDESLTISNLEEIIGSKIQSIFYSASHIQEALEIKGDNEQHRIDRINKRLETIEKITQGNYINENIKNEVFKLRESPFEVIKTITDVSFAQDAMKGLANLISEEQKIETRKLLNIDPKRINNYKPEEVVEHLNKKLTDTGQNYKFLDMIEIGISHHPDGKTFGVSNRIAAIFELLDMLGYWKDKYNNKSNYARLWDSSHAFYASHFNYFITDDKRTVNKSKVVYNIYDVQTKVISTSLLKNIG
jgi:UDP-N-acetyl-D-mannosaminuronate dehydrogenase